MFGVLQSREVIAAAAIAVVLAPAYALVGSSPEAPVRAVQAAGPVTTVGSGSPVGQVQHTPPAAPQPRAGEHVLAQATQAHRPTAPLTLVQSSPVQQSRIDTQPFSAIPSHVAGVLQSGRAEITAFARTRVTLKRVPLPIRVVRRIETVAEVSSAPAPVDVALAVPNLPVRPRVRARYPTMIMRHPLNTVDPSVQIAFPGVNGPTQLIRGPNRPVISAAVSDKRGDDELALPLVTETPRTRAAYPLLAQRHPMRLSTRSVRLAVRSIDVEALAIASTPLSLQSIKRERFVSPTLLSRHPVLVPSSPQTAPQQPPVFLASLPTRSAVSRARIPSMPLLPHVAAPEAGNADATPASVTEPSVKPYIPWATRQQQAQAVRTGPVHGNPHLVPHVTSFPSKHKPGTIIVHVKEKRLYLVESDTTARVYPIGTAHGALDVLGQTRVTTRRNMPTWTPTPNQRRRDPTLPRRVEAGPENPLGVRAIGLGWRYRLIHGTSDPSSIGYARSDGCIRMLNDDVVDLFKRVKVGNRVLVLASAQSPLTEWRPADYVEYKPRKRLKRRKWRKKRTRSRRRYASRRGKRRR